MSAHPETQKAVINQARAVMRRDDACDILQPSDIRVLVGMIDDLERDLHDARTAAGVARRVALSEAIAAVHATGNYERQENAIRSLSPALDLDALVERGAEALFENNKPTRKGGIPWEQVTPEGKALYRWQARSVLIDVLGTTG